MSDTIRNCPDCDTKFDAVNRRNFIKTAGAATVAASASSALAAANKSDQKKSTPETVVKRLYDSLNDVQKKAVCFAWDHQDGRRGLLRTRISNNWHITKQEINSEFYNAKQRQMIREIYEGIYQPEWQAKVDQQLKDDAGGWGRRQNIAIFGTPGEDKFEFVMTGRHITIRCDGNSADHVAFGGPIFYGHAAGGFNEKPDHPGNVYWEQALLANDVYKVLDGKQRKLALVQSAPHESSVPFRGKDGKFDGIPIAELSSDQKDHVQKVLQKLVEPYRQSDRDEVAACLKAQGGIDQCSLAFYRKGDLGKDEIWDVWRLEGPSFVWHFRGSPHVHVWANVASDASVQLNA